MVNLSDSATKKLKDLLAAEAAPEQGLRVRVVGGGCSGFQYQLEFDAPAENDQVFERDGVKVVIDPKSYLYLMGSEIDYVDGLHGAGFTLRNPNARGTCGCGQSFTA